MIYSGTRGLFLAALLCSSSAVIAQEEQPSYAPAPDWIDPAELPPLDERGERVFLISDNQIRIEGGRELVYSDIAYQLVSPEMLSAAGNIQLQWQPDVQDMLIHSIQIVRGGDVIDALADDKRLEVIRREANLERLAIDGVLTATMQLTGLQLGDVIRIRATRVNEDPALDGNAAGLQPIPAAPVQIGLNRFRLIWPTRTPLKWTADDGARIAETERAGEHEIRFEGVLPKPREQADNAPARFTKPPTINYSTFADWNAVSRSAAKLFEDRASFDPDGGLAGEVTRIATESSDATTRMASAVALVQSKIRYLYNGLAFGNYTPQDPDVTWQKRYGDCKAKSLLLTTILRALGIDAQPMLVNMKDGDVIGDLLPGFYPFNHMVVRARVDGTDYWLDGTKLGTTPANILDVPLFYKALPLTTDGSGLVDVPFRPLSVPTKSVEKTIDNRAGIGFPTLVHTVVTLRGDEAAAMKTAQAGLDKDSFQDQLDQFLGNEAWGSGFATDASVRFEDDGRTAIVTGQTIENGFWSWSGHRYETELSPWVETHEFNENRGRPEWSDTPVYIGDATYWTYKVSVLLPENATSFDLTGKPVFDERIAGIHFQHDFRLNGNRLDGSMVYRSVAAEVPASDLPNIRADLARARADKLKLVAPPTVESKAVSVVTAYKEGRAASLKKAYDGAVARAEPDELLPYRNRASFLMGVGDHDGAAADIEHVLGREPDVENYLLLARMREQDHPELALAAVAEARKLDPSSTETMREMAKILWLHHRPEEMLSAADEFESAGVERKDIAIVRANALAQSGKSEEALALLGAAFDAKPGDAELYRASCELKAGYGLALDSALKDCTRAAELSESSYAALENRGLIYWRKDRREEAMEDWRSALLTNPDAQHARYFIGLAAGGKDGQRLQDQAIMADPELPLEARIWKLKS
ncbi:DUF3857 domain-containing protein [Novosphingopyxis sp.]|uniref:DUF3857 domain-containing protein n=1 Tax=Novosphingopyxis sp. TaxID=2709690 RepID=UPI003B5B5253